MRGCVKSQGIARRLTCWDCSWVRQRLIIWLIFFNKSKCRIYKRKTKEKSHSKFETVSLFLPGKQLENVTSIVWDLPWVIWLSLPANDCYFVSYPPNPNQQTKTNKQTKQTKNPKMVSTQLWGVRNSVNLQNLGCVSIFRHYGFSEITQNFFFFYSGQQ